MKICIVTQQLRNVHSGVGLHARNLIRNLFSQGHSVTVIVPQGQKPIGSFPYEIVTVGDSKMLRSQARWLSTSFNFSSAIKKLERKHSFDLIHFTDVRDSFLCKTRSPKIGNINDTYAAELKGIGYYKKHYFDWLERWLYYRFVHLSEQIRLPSLDGIITNSSFTHETIKREYSINPSKIHQCYKSVDINRYENIAQNRLAVNRSHENVKLLFVGGNMQRKGLLDLIEAAPIITKKFPAAKFIVAGKDKFLPRYINKCKKLGIAANFSFLGWVSQDKLLDLYESATVFVMPSLTEALGVVFLEAMAAGVPVVGTNVGGIPEIIRNEENGLLVPVNSPVCLADAITLIVSNPNLSRTFSTNALQTVKQFSIEKMMDCTNKIYKQFV